MSFAVAPSWMIKRFPGAPPSGISVVYEKASRGRSILNADDTFLQNIRVILCPDLEVISIKKGMA